MPLTILNILAVVTIFLLHEYGWKARVCTHGDNRDEGCVPMRGSEVKVCAQGVHKIWSFTLGKGRGMSKARE